MVKGEPYTVEAAHRDRPLVAETVNSQARREADLT